MPSTTAALGAIKSASQRSQPRSGENSLAIDFSRWVCCRRRVSRVAAADVYRACGTLTRVAPSTGCSRWQEKCRRYAAVIDAHSKLQLLPFVGAAPAECMFVAQQIRMRPSDKPTIENHP